MSTVGNWRGPNIVKDGLVLYLDPGSPNSYFDKSGTIIKDISGNNYSGSLVNGPTYDTGSGGSLVFDGTDDYIDTTLTTNFSTADFSLGAIVYPTFDNASFGRPIIAKAETGGCGTYDFALEFGRTSNKFSIVVAGGVNYVLYSTSTYVKNSWYYVSCTRKNLGVNSYLYNLYVNGVLDATVTGNYYGGNGGKMAIGKYVGCVVVNSWLGKISTTQIYNRSLTAAEVLQNYNATKNRFGL